MLPACRVCWTRSLAIREWLALTKSKKEFDLNLPRFIESQETEGLQDIAGHLFGGIPVADIDALQQFWDVYPTLRRSSFKPKISRNSLASGSIGLDFADEPGASALRLILVLWQIHSVLRFANILDDRVQIILGINTLAIAQCRPNRTLSKLFPVFSQSACRVGFQLVANIVAGVTRCCYDHMHVIRSRRQSASLGCGNCSP